MLYVSPFLIGFALMWRDQLNRPRTIMSEFLVLLVVAKDVASEADVNRRGRQKESNATA